MTPLTRGLVDSGADCCQFPGSWASVLGIDLATDCDQGNGTSAGGGTTIYRFRPGIHILFAGEKVHVEATFNNDLPIILLGRDDLFQEYRTSFDHRTKTFRLESYE